MVRRARSWVLVLATVVALVPVAHGDDKADLGAAIANAKAAAAKGDFPEAVRQYEQALSLAPAVFGADAENTATIVYNLAGLYQQMGLYAKAEPLFQRCLRFDEAKLGPDHLLVATTVNNLAMLYYSMGQYAKAEPLFERCLKVREGKLGADDVSVAASLNNLAQFYSTTGQYAKAEPLFQRSLKINEAKMGPDHPGVAPPLNNLAELYRTMGQYAKAEPLYLRSLKIRETKLGSDHPDVAQSLNNLAVLYVNMGQYSKAESLYQRSLKIDEAKRGPDHLSVSTTLNNLAALYVQMGQYPMAEPLFQRSLKNREARLGKDHVVVAQSLGNLAALYVDMGQYPKAEPLYRRSLNIYEAKLGVDHPDVAAGLNNLGKLYYNMGQYAKAEPLFQRSLKIREARLGSNHPSVAISLNNLASLYIAMGQYAQVEPLYQRSLKIGESTLGPDHPDVALRLGNLASLYCDLRQYDKAEPLYQRSLKIREAKLGPDHPEVATSLNNLAYNYQKTGQYAQAEPLYQRSLKIGEAMLGPDHPDVAQSLSNLAALHVELSQFDAARVEFDRARHIVRRHVGAVLSMLSEQEQTTFLEKTDRGALHLALSLSWTRPEDAAGAAASASWLANGKAVAQEALAQRAALARDSVDSQLKPIAQQLIEVRKHLANLNGVRPKPGQEADRRAELVKLADQEQDLARQLSRAGGTTAPAVWVELDAIRRAIPKNGMLVDIIQFRPWTFAGNGVNTGQPAHYAAWMTPPIGAGDVKIVDLGEADKIDDAVRQYQTAMAAAEDLLESGEPQATAELQKPLSALARLLLDPLNPAIGDKTELIVSPDASLWLIPWAALPIDEQGKFAVEKWNIHFVTSARDLATERKAASTNPPRVFANPNYDLPPAEMSSALANVFGSQLTVPTAAPLSSSSGQALVAGLDRGRRSVAMIGRASSLPGTADEAKAIMPNLQKYAGLPKLYTDRQALEGVFKRLAAPRVLVLSTHGFFLPDQQVKREDKEHAGLAGEGPSRKHAVSADGNGLENPLLRCGLLLAGCNQRSQITDESLDDGVLTGMEIVGTNLRGTELVVLSACETGLGQVHNGEGVAGLRQAFQLAGAQAVVSTLWQIPDTETAELMNSFFNSLARGKSPPNALRGAQLAMIQARRKKSGAAHPFYWAAFTLTGQSGPTLALHNGNKVVVNYEFRWGSEDAWETATMQPLGLRVHIPPVVPGNDYPDLEVRFADGESAKLKTGKAYLYRIDPKKPGSSTQEKPRTN